MTVDAAIKGPGEAAPARFADAYAELQAIATKLKPVQGQIPDIDAIEPLIKRANVLANHCQERIDAVRKLIGEQTVD